MADCFFVGRLGAPRDDVFHIGKRRGLYSTLLRATRLTFGTISALFGLNHVYIEQSQYTVLVSVVILSAVAATLIAERFFRPEQGIQVLPPPPRSCGEDFLCPE